MPDEGKNFGDSLVLDFRKGWRPVKRVYSLSFDIKRTAEFETELALPIILIA